MIIINISLAALLIIGSTFHVSHSFQLSPIGKSASASASASASTSASTSTSALAMKTIDSHLHVWANSIESKDYPYAPNQTPPDTLKEISSTSSLLSQMKQANVDGALIVQPINHQYDHRYVAQAMKDHPDKFKGMLLFDPSLGLGLGLQDQNLALARLEELVLEGFVGVRFNPYLFPADAGADADAGAGGQSSVMSQNQAAVAVFKRCAELKVPVGIMCFKGIDLHYDDIVSLCEMSPDTIVILDHFGFASVQGVDSQEKFDMVLKLAEYNVVVKISALFRLGDEDSDPPYERVKTERLDPLLKAYGADRLMFGTDFPFVTQETIGYKGAVDIVSSWLSELGDDDESQKDAVMGGTAERLFGTWG